MRFDPGIYRIGRVCHEANRAFCLENGETNSPLWDHACDELKESVAAGVVLALGDENITPDEMHDSWVKFMLAHGWKYGHALDVEYKMHPNLIEYDSLPMLQRTKDELFLGIVNSLRHMVR